MTIPPEKLPGPTGLCWFALQRLPPLLDAFAKEMDGVRASEDIEYIHRMRVASRRLRAALPLFRACFPPKQYARWMREVSAMTRALGEARDADVQIAFLVKCRKKYAPAKGRNGSTGPAPANPLEPAIAFLLQELRGTRQQLQLRVLSASDALIKSGIVSGMHTAFAVRAGACHRTPVQFLAFGIPTIAAFRIESRLEVMRSFEPWVTHADAVAEHHAMRIAAKKLRYTMEVYGPVYRRGLLKPHARVKKVQEILGDLHDCDVWIDQVTRLLLKERGRLRADGRKKSPDTATLASLRLFLRDREQERTLLHRRFVRYWQSLENQKTWDELRHTLIHGRIARFVPAREYPEEDVRRICNSLAASLPEKLSHHETVTRLALALFDSLLPLREMSGHDRCLLECAGMLHDIGWMDGARRHNAYSARRIFSDETLPLDISDRIATGLIALAHRGKVTVESHPLYLLLPAEHQKKILLLASILRVADGLDYFHTSTVTGVRCTIRENEVLCEVTADVDAAKEKERARARSALFVREFGRELVMP